MTEEKKKEIANRRQEKFKNRSKQANEESKNRHLKLKAKINRDKLIAEQNRSGPAKFIHTVIDGEELIPQQKMRATFRPKDQSHDLEDPLMKLAKESVLKKAAQEGVDLNLLQENE